MVVLHDNVLAPDFLASAALPVVRALVPYLFPNSKARARSTEELISRLPPQPWKIEPRALREALWAVMAADGHAIHMGILAKQELDGETAGRILPELHAAWTASGERNVTITTGTVIDARLSGMAGQPLLEVLHLGEVEAEVYDEEMSYRRRIDQAEYVFKAYRITGVPVVSTVQVGPGLPFIPVTTLPIHRHARLTSEVLGLQILLEQELGLPFPPVAGIACGIRTLWGGSVQPRKYDVEEGDGTRATVTLAPGAQNQRSVDLDQQLRQWDLRAGSLVYDGNTAFRVDTGKALFSFRTKTTRQRALDVIRAILGAA
jgi:hypothetical protein